MNFTVCKEWKRNYLKGKRKWLEDKKKKGNRKSKHLTTVLKRISGAWTTKLKKRKIKMLHNKLESNIKYLSVKTKKVLGSPNIDVNMDVKGTTTRVIFL